MAHQSIGTDILSEILSRATLQTVGRFRLVSKECSDLTYRSYFMHLHCQRTRTISGFLLASMMSHKHPAEFVSTDNNIPNIVSLRFLPGFARILACTNQGLLLCLNSRPKCHRIPEYYVCKPTTKEWQQIPNPKTRYFARNVAMMVLRLDPLRYKIIRLSEPSHLRNLNRKHAYEHCFRCEVFDSERWAWRQLEEMYLPYDEVLTSKPAISACGAFHWLTSEKNILAFNADDETWTMLSVPDAVNNKSYYLQLAGYQGKLACLRKERGREDCFELWVMEDYFGKKLWNKKHTVSTKPLQIEERFVSPEALYNAENALVRSYYDRVYFYKFTDGSFDAVKLKNGHYDQGIFPFQSDFEPSNLRICRRFKIHPRQRPRRSLQRCNEFIHLLGLGCRRALNPTLMFIFLLLIFTLFCSVLDEQGFNVNVSL
ncbi:hypothetical protein WN944_024421 [Citrus x changshan-huyou]|uniref:F-box associated beta-propeller type 3 domain-containing protein n=1 Tax=Citrus x changshan-huyou TaxID=2935761 RepID=A0AAP0LMZ1_9ROSI